MTATSSSSPRNETGRDPEARSAVAWGVLAALLALLLAGAATLDRSSWPYSLVGDEATYLMQAESLAWDFDLLYSRRDFDRFVEHRNVVPEGLILQSGDDGATITFGKPIFYALYVAPFVRWAPLRGPLVANALLLALAAVVSARTLERRAGALAPLLVAALVFGSVAFVYTFWAHADLFLMSLSALAFALAYGDESGPGSARRAWTVVRWIVAGALLAMVGFSRPMYFTLLLPALAAGRARRRGWPAMLAGFVLLIVSTGAVHQWLSESWTGYGASRRGFYSWTGFPEVDFPASEWDANLAQHGDHAVASPADIVRRRKFDVSLWTWNSVYFLIGGHVGLVPFFFPVLLCLRDRPRGFAGWSLVAAVALSAAAFFYLRPFNFYGGGGAVANRYFLPLYPALWFLARRPPRAAGLIAAGVGSALFILPLWLHPRAYPLEADGRYRYVGPAAACCLPYETTLSHLKVSGREDVHHRGLWIRFLDGGVQPLDDGEFLRLAPGLEGQILVGSYRPLEALEVELRAPPGTRLEVEEGTLEKLDPKGRRWRIVLGRPRAVHPMWWTREPFRLYRLSFRLDSDRPVRMALSPVPPRAVAPL